MILISRLFMLIAIVVVLLFCVTNLEPVTVKLIGWESPQLPLSLVLLFAFFFGFFIALFWQALRTVTMKKEYRPKPLVVPPPMPESEQKEKKERKWGLGKAKKKDKAKESESSAEEKGTAEEVVDKDGAKINIADEPTDVPAIEDK